MQDPKQGNKNYYKGIVNNTNSSLKVTLYIREGEEEMQSNAAKMPISLDKEKNKEVLTLPIYANDGKMPYINSIEICTNDVTKRWAYSARKRGDKVDVLLNTHDTYIIAMTGNEIEIKGENCWYTDSQTEEK